MFSTGEYEVLYSILEVFKESNVKFTVRQIQLFLLVADAGTEGITQTDLAGRTGDTQASISRNCRALSVIAKKTDAGRKLIGSDLVEMRPDLDESRRLNVRLTQKGQKVHKSILKKLKEMTHG